MDVKFSKYFPKVRWFPFFAFNKFEGILAL